MQCGNHACAAERKDKNEALPRVSDHRGRPGRPLGARQDPRDARRRRAGRAVGAAFFPHRDSYGGRRVGVGAGLRCSSRGPISSSASSSCCAARSLSGSPSPRRWPGRRARRLERIRAPRRRRACPAKRCAGSACRMDRRNPRIGEQLLAGPAAPRPDAWASVRFGLGRARGGGVGAASLPHRAPHRLASRACEPSCSSFRIAPRRARRGHDHARALHPAGVAIGILSPASMLVVRSVVGESLSWHDSGVLQALWRISDWVCGLAGGLLSVVYLPRMASAYPHPGIARCCANRSAPS